MRFGKSSKAKNKENKIMRYKIPQFVDMEDKIIGPITMRQLIILGVGGIITYGAYMEMASGNWWLVGGPAAILALAFAFVRVQDMTFFRYVLATVQYIVKPERRVWQQRADYIRPPKDLFKKVEKKDDRHRQDDKDSLERLGEYVELFNGGDENLVFDAFHSKEKGGEIKDRVSGLKQSSTKSVQERIAKYKENLIKNPTQRKPLVQNN